MCDLSIIVPVYNAEKYIERTVNALLTQENVSYEVILIDDGSKDKSNTICTELCRKYKKIRYFRIDNGGPGRARNIGIESALGTYVAFCDSDDIPAKNMYGLLYEIMIATGADYCLCDIYTERDEKNFGFPWMGDKVFENDENVQILLASMIGNKTDDDLNTPVWGSSVRGLYKHEILNNYTIRFPEDIRFAEDLVFNARYLVHCKKTYVLNKVLYRYTYNVNSLMTGYTKYNSKMFDERITLVRHINEISAPYDKDGELNIRLKTSARSYFHECVGNAARAIPQKGIVYAYREIKSILNNPIVCDVFADIDIQDRKKNLIYRLIQKKCSGLLLTYYGVRLRQKNWGMK